MDFEKFNSWGIYRTPLAQVMERPVAEPPDIDMIGIFEEPNTVEFMKNIDKTIPDMTLQSDFLSIWAEQHALGKYLSWTFDAGRAAMACDDEARVKFYEDLVNTLQEDFAAVNEDLIRTLNQIVSREWNIPLRLDSGQRFSFRHSIGAPWSVTFIRSDHTSGETSHPIQNYSNSEGGRSTNVEFEIIDEGTIDNELSINDEITTDEPKDILSYEQESSGNDELEEYEVESVLDCRSGDGAMEYLIKWKGYDNDESSWEPLDNLKCPELLTEFEQRRARETALNRRPIKERERRDKRRKTK